MQHFSPTRRSSDLGGPVGNETGLPIPRYVTLRASEVNVRAGPGVRYPIEWVYQRQNLPVEVVAEFDTWRKIRDPDGVEGWVHQQVLRSEEHTSELQSLMRNSYAVFCLKKKT